MAVIAIVVIVSELALVAHRVSELGPIWGWTVAAALLLGGSLLGVVCWREGVGWLRVRRVERLRVAVESAGFHWTTRTRLVHAWMASLPEGDRTSTLIAQWDAAAVARDDASASAAVSEYLTRIDQRVDGEIRREAARTGVIVSLSGIALLDAVLCIWRNLRLMRRIATDYGARPGIIGTVRLLRMVLIHAVAVDLTQHAAEAVSTRIGTVAAAGGQGIVAATLTVRVGLWTQQVCRPIELPRRSIAGFAVASAADEVTYRIRQTVERAASLLRVRPGTSATAP
jgi:putative membrane protein